MPLVVQLLFADADAELVSSCKAATGRYAAGMANKMHLLTAQGIYEELQNQLDAKDSTLRSAGSAFGILAASGTSLRVCGNKVVTEADLPDKMILCSGPKWKEQSRESPIDDTEPARPLCEKIALTQKVPVTVRGCRANPEGPVPRISNFPGEWYNIPHAWWTSYAPDPCRSSCSVSRMKAVVICESRCSPSLQGTCEPARIMGVSHGDVASVYEAGSGGWPLCVPHAYAAFRPAQSKSMLGTETASGAAAGTVSGSAFQSKEESLQAQFHYVSLEADDDEMTLLLSVSSNSDGTDLPSWLKSTRIVVPRANVSSSKLWSTREVITCWPQDLESRGGPGYHNWVEISCTPRNAPAELSLILALPSKDIAYRFHDAYNNTPRPPRPQGFRGGERGAIIVELQLLAKVDLSQDGQAQNCGMSMRRSICEAMGINRNRVQVLNVSDGGGSILGWAAVQWSGFQQSLQPKALPMGNKAFVLDV